MCLFIGYILQYVSALLLKCWISYCCLTYLYKSNSEAVGFAHTRVTCVGVFIVCVCVLTLHSTQNYMAGLQPAAEIGSAGKYQYSYSTSGVCSMADVSAVTT